MPRQLPWKVNNPGTPKQGTGRQPKATPTSSSSTHSPAPPGPRLPTTARSTPKPKTENPRRSLGLTRARSHSTSPPPEPLPEEFMREGADKDDRFRMVEDEFLAVAHDFTRHIHAAEYHRLKGLARSQNEETIQNISRPVTGEMTDKVKRRHAAFNTAARQKKALGKRRAEADSEGEEGEKSKQKGAANSLQGLMDSPRKKAVPLALLSSTNLGGVVSPSKRRSEHMRGVQNSSRRAEPVSATESGSEEDDDLDGGQMDYLPRHSRIPETATRKPEVSTPQRSAAESALSRLGNRPPGETQAQSSRILPASNPDTPRSMPTRGTPRRQTTTRISTTEDREIKQEDDGDDDDDDFFSRIRSRRAETRRRSGGVTPKSQTTRAKVEKTSDSQQDTLSLDEIPSFL